MVYFLRFPYQNPVRISFFFAYVLCTPAHFMILFLIFRIVFCESTNYVNPLYITENVTARLNSLCGQNLEFITTAGGTYSNHYALKG